MKRATDVRFGVIGCGTIAYWTHLRELPRIAGAQLVAAADPDPVARERAARLAGIPVHADAGELLARTDLDAVVICSPNALHADLAIAAAQAGKHFYLEKPIAISAEGARAVVDAAAKAAVVAAVGFNRRCHPAFVQARRIMEEGKIGRVLAVQTAFCEPSSPGTLPDWKRRRGTGGGVLLDLASHHIDLLRWFLREEIATVEARIESRSSEHDCAWLRVGTASGVEAGSFFSGCAGRIDQLEFVGERGALRVDRFRGRLSLRLSRRFGYGVRSVPVWPDTAVVTWQLRRLLRPSWESSYRRALAAFTEMCRGGPGTLATLADGQCALDVVLAAEQSAGLGTRVRLDEFSR